MKKFIPSIFGRAQTTAVISLVALALVSGSCGRPQTKAGEGAGIPPAFVPPEVQQVLDQVEPDRIKGHVHFLADDLLEGRRPGTRGFDLAALYVETQFKAMGLQPAGEKGTYRQEVPLRQANTLGKESSFVIDRGKGRKQILVFGKDFLFLPNTQEAQVDLKTSAVYVGYGISAPELGYDDYAQVDVKGKLVIFQRGAPNTFSEAQAATYSDFERKSSQAIARGAVGTIRMSPVESVDPRWVYFVNHVQKSSSYLAWEGPDGTVNQEYKELRVHLILPKEAAAAFLADAPVPLEEARAKIAKGEPQSFELPLEIQLQSRTRHTRFKSPNVVALLPGSDPHLKNEYLVYVAHLDHDGIGAPVQGDSIYNGAHDNASGTGIMLEVARAFTRLPHPPKRSLLFLGVTAEEAGLIGSDYFVHFPTVPEGSMVAAFSTDMPFLLHPLQDIIPRGAEHSSLRGPVEAAARHLGLTVSPDPTPEENFFLRSDQYSFVKKGILGLTLDWGYLTGDPAINGRLIDSTWLASVYHTPLDNPDQPFDWGAAKRLAQVNFLTGYLVANDPKRPVWNEGDELGKKFGAKNVTK